MIYREHRGSFAESMKTARKITDMSELGDVVVEEYGYDERLKSDTKIVLKGGRPIGFVTEEESE